MNTIFLSKIIKAKKLEYEALKEIMPSGIRKKVDSFEKEAFNLIKGIAIEMIKDETVVVSNEDKKVVKKIGVDFK